MLFSALRKQYRQDLTIAEGPSSEEEAATEELMKILGSLDLSIEYMVAYLESGNLTAIKVSQKVQQNGFKYSPAREYGEVTRLILSTNCGKCLLTAFLMRAQMPTTVYAYYPQWRRTPSHSRSSAWKMKTMKSRSETPSLFILILL